MRDHSSAPSVNAGPARPSPTATVFIRESRPFSLGLPACVRTGSLWSVGPGLQGKVIRTDCSCRQFILSSASTRGSPKLRLRPMVLAPALQAAIGQRRIPSTLSAARLRRARVSSRSASVCMSPRSGSARASTRLSSFRNTTCQVPIVSAGGCSAIGQQAFVQDLIFGGGQRCGIGRRRHVPGCPSSRSQRSRNAT